MRTTLCVLLAAGIGSAQQGTTLENAALRLELRETDGSLRLIDKSTGVLWQMNPPLAIFASGLRMSVRPAGGKVARTADSLRYTAEEGYLHNLDVAYPIRHVGQDPGIEIVLTLRENPPAIEYSYVPRENSGTNELLLLNSSLPLGPGAGNYYAAPQRMGLLFPVEGEKPWSRRLVAFETRSGYSMSMFGAVQKGSALLVSWDDPYTEPLIDYAPKPEPRLTAGFSLRRSARSITIQPLGRGGYVEIAKAYRETARRRGLVKTLAEKRKENPSVERFFGAADFKPFAFLRLVPGSRRNNSSQELLAVNFTFDECAALAEHYKNDLGIDRALLVVNGWINGGYDVRHPDILPAAPELGGNEGLKECSRRVRGLGWLLGLHDNYQDLYRDAPSYSEELIAQLPDGSLRKGGIWNGGQAYIICSRKSLELAARPKNVAGAKELFNPDLYFSDTLFATPLYECYSPKHPIDKVEDMGNKRQLADFIRKTVGLMGSEEGREWAVSRADYFEGLMSHKTGFRRASDQADDIVIPMFEIVFGDSIPMYAHQSDRPRPDEANKILDHILYAEMPVYYFGNHRYWTDPAQDYQAPPGSGRRLVFARGGRFGLIDQFIKNTYEVLSPLNRETALLPMTDHHFLTPDRKVESTRFGGDVEITVNYGERPFATARATLPEYGFLVESPRLLAVYATRYKTVRFTEPTLFVMRALDGRPLAWSANVRVYRAFGDRRLPLGGRTVEVDNERTLSVEPGR